MAPKTGEKLSNAPLIYVLAQIRFSPILATEKYIPSIQERVRREYPRYQQNIIQTFRFGPEGQPPDIAKISRWEFADKDSTHGFIIQQDSFVFHTTGYTTFPEFKDKLQSALLAVNESLDISLVERIGLRYVDIVEPTGDDKLSDYLVPGVAGFPHEDIGVQPVVSQTESISDSEFGRLVLKVIKKKDEKNVPPDLFPLALKLSRKVAQGSPNALLDFDHFFEQSIDFSVDAVIEKIDQLHEVTSKAFWSVITEHAKDVWS
ncbi:MAG: hypothetical protein CMN57_05290 [Gammaproteobacteria bacterium]|nr:hypothetical protein [Gammaproteobacteria bacterium]